MKGHGHFCWRYENGMVMIPNYDEVWSGGPGWIHWSEDGVRFAPIQKTADALVFGSLYVPNDPLAGDMQLNESTTELWGFESVKPSPDPKIRDWNVERIEWRIG